MHVRNWIRPVAAFFVVTACALLSPLVSAQSERDQASAPGGAQSQEAQVSSSDTDKASTTESSGEPSSATAASTSRVERFARRALGTDVELLVFTEDPVGAKSAADAAFAEIDRIEQLMSEWKADSEVNRINQTAGGPPVSISKDTVAVLKVAQTVSEASGGAFSMTWAALKNLWNFQVPEGQAPIVPNAESVQQRLAFVDDSKLKLTDTTVQLSERGMALGLGGITKGHATDRALNVLKEKGYPNALAFVGGDIASSGTKGAQPWVVGLQEPRAEGYFAVLTLDDEAIATSGDYETFFELDGKRYHHVIDPRTGFPAEGVRSVSAISKDAASADAYATAIFVLGPEKGLALAESTDGLEAVIVDAQNRVIVSRGLASRLRILHQPAE